MAASRICASCEVVRLSRALVVALHELGELRVLRALFLGPVGPAVARAPGPADPRRGLVLALCGALGVLGVVYCNPDVARLGPSRAYPVDAGGLKPALIGTRRSPAKPAAGAEAQPNPVPAEPGLTPGTGAPELSPGTGAPGLSPGAGAPGLSPGTGAPELAPGTGAPGPSPGTGVELPPGAGSGAGAAGAAAPAVGGAR